MLNAVILYSFLFLNLLSAQDKHDLNPKTKSENIDLAEKFFSLLTVDKLSASRECMRSSAFTTVVNGKEYLRVTSPMSNGYYYGTMLSYARSFCDSKKSEKSLRGYYSVLNAKPHGGSDSLSHLMNFVSPGTNPLQHNFAILFALGCIETDGKFNDGRDAGAWNIDAKSAEAGLHQSSYDSTDHVSLGIYNLLMKKYENGKSPLCMTHVYKIEQELSANIENWGWGPGVDFQEAMKNCPALATDYQAYLLRKTFAHNGPVKRSHAQPREECIEVMSELKSVLERPNVCSQLEGFVSDFASRKEAAFDFKADEQVPRLLVRPETPWVVGGENTGWSYEPLVLKDYWLSSKYLDASGKLKSREASETKKPYPRYSEIPWIKNNLSYWKSVSLWGTDEEKKTAIERTAFYESEMSSILNNAENKQKALEKLKHDLERADLVIHTLQKELAKYLQPTDRLSSKDTQAKLAKLSGERKSKAIALLKFKDARDKMAEKETQIQADFVQLN